MSPYNCGEIKINQTSIGWGYSPTFSYGKDRIAYIDTLYNIIVTDLFKYDTVQTMSYKQRRPVLSWDTAGNIYYFQRLCIIKLDTATRNIDTVYTFTDSSWFHEYCYRVSGDFCTREYEWQLIEGNVVDGKYASFTMHRGDNVLNTVWYADIENNITKRIFTDNPFCQAALSYDNKKVYGMPFGHRKIDYCSPDSTKCSYISVKYEVLDSAAWEVYEPHFWTTRTFKFAPNLISFYDSNDSTCSIYDETLKKIVFTDSCYYIYDYIPMNLNNKSENFRKINHVNTKNIGVIYDIRGRRYSVYPKFPGIYFRKTTHGFKRFVVLQ